MDLIVLKIWNRKNKTTMGYKYRHPATAINGIILYLQDKYKGCDVVEKMLKSGHLSSVNEFMKKYRLSRGNKPSNYCDKNANYIQQDFKSFVEYCKINLKNV